MLLHGEAHLCFLGVCGEGVAVYRTGVVQEGGWYLFGGQPCFVLGKKHEHNKTVTWYVGIMGMDHTSSVGRVTFFCIQSFLERYRLFSLLGVIVLS